MADQGTDTRTQRPRLRGRLHLGGALLAVAAAPWLVQAAATPALRAAAAVYVVGIVAMLGVSALYHVPTWRPRNARMLRRLDHSTIFVGVAATYTPVVVAAMDGRGRAALLAVVWAGAVGGMVVRNVALDAPPWLRALPYVALGWIALVALPALWRFSAAVTALVVAGGLVYTAGAFVYVSKRPDPWPRTFGYHEVFHTLVLAAVALHWTGVWLSVSA